MLNWIINFSSESTSSAIFHFIISAYDSILWLRNIFYFESLFSLLAAVWIMKKIGDEALLPMLIRIFDDISNYRKRNIGPLETPSK
jgi:hypothetical protein